MSPSCNTLAYVKGATMLPCKLRFLHNLGTENGKSFSNSITQNMKMSF